MGFRQHIVIVKNRATKTASRPLTDNDVSGFKSEKQELLMSVVHSQLLYTVIIWSGALVYERNKHIRPPNTALRVASAYRTVSAITLMVMVGFPLIHKKKILNKAKKKARVNTIEKWQAEQGELDARRTD